jgi:hypothetical protein
MKYLIPFFILVGILLYAQTSVVKYQGHDFMAEEKKSDSLRLIEKNMPQLRANQSDSIEFQNRLIKYSLVFKSRDYTALNGAHNLSCAEVIIEDKKIKRTEAESLLREIAIKYKINELTAFRNKEARDLFYASLKLQPEPNEFLENNFLGIVYVE